MVTSTRDADPMWANQYQICHLGLICLCSQRQSAAGDRSFPMWIHTKLIIDLKPITSFSLPDFSAFNQGRVDMTPRLKLNLRVQIKGADI